MRRLWNGRRLAAIVLSFLALATAASFGHGIPRATPGTAATRTQIETWAKAARARRPTVIGCYTARYPNTAWTKVTCGPPLSKNALPQAAPPSFGSAALLAQNKPPSATINSASGTISDVTNATGETTQTGTKTPGSNPGGAMVYSLQLNTGLASAFNSTLCSKPTGWVQGQALCIEWVQFVFTNNATSPGGHVGTSSAVEYVLWNYLNNHNECPTGWTSTTGNAACYYGSPSSVLPVENLPNGASITVAGIVGSQNLDTIEVLDGVTLYATVVSRPFQLPFWYQTQFNIFGDSGGAVAIFPPGATMLVTTKVPGPSTCVQNSLTSERANLGAASNCVVSATTSGGTAMTFAEGVPPILNSVSPTNVPFSGGPIQIQGVGFAPRAAIWIGGRTAPAVCDTSTHCTATIPSFPASTSSLNVYVANKTPSGAYLGPYSASSANGRVSFYTPLSCQIKGVGCSGSDGKYLFTVACPVVSDVSVDGVPLGTGLSFVGEGHVGSTNVVACAHGVPNNCYVHPTPTGGGVCHVSPPPPVKSCLVCQANGQQCVPNASGGGYRCVGTIR